MDFNFNLKSALERAHYQMAIERLHSYLIEKSLSGSESLQFLVRMSYEESKNWVEKCFLDYMKLNQEHPDLYPTDKDPEEITRIVRSIRKQRSQEKKNQKKSFN